MLESCNSCQIISGANGRAIGTWLDTVAGALITVVKDKDTTDPSQLWWCLEYFNTQGADTSFALLTMYSNSLYALSMTPGVTYPFLTPFKLDPSYLWQLGDGISPVRDSDYCLTMEGAGTGNDPWPPGTRIQAYEWQQGHYDNQLGTIQTVTGQAAPTPTRRNRAASSR